MSFGLRTSYFERTACLLFMTQKEISHEIPRTLPDAEKSRNPLSSILSQSIACIPSMISNYTLQHTPSLQDCFLFDPINLQSLMKLEVRFHKTAV